MILNELRAKILGQLSKLYSKNESNIIFELLAKKIMDLKKISISETLNKEVERLHHEKFDSSLADLLRNVPIQYVVGETNFYGLTINVNPSVLIPRPETEELVEWLLEQSKTFTTPMRILDIGTGSGCIAIALKKKIPKAEVLAMDVSNNALTLAKENSLLNKVEIEFVEDSILEIKSEKLLKAKFDFIVSNPPYISKDEIQSMPENVKSHEPHLALFVEDSEPLIFYKKIAAYAFEHLSENGMLFFEISEYRAMEVIDILKSHRFIDISLKKDLQDKDRMISCRKV